MPGSLLCPVCQSALAASAPEGLCPKCLWASLLSPEAGAVEPETPPLSPSSAFPVSPGDSSFIFGDYEPLREIARGGMGVVYQARQISLNRVVALKMILTARLPGEADMKRFRAEAEAVASLEHPNIVPIYEVGEDEGSPFFTMKFMAGGSLAERLARGGRSDHTRATGEVQARSGAAEYTAPEITGLMAKIARAVHHAHQHGILHRDLKPSNILLDERGEPLVADFGLARHIEGDSNLTLSGAVLGTPAYMAPEQAAGGKRLTTAADVYSLGAILYELLVRRPPFAGASVMETLQKVLHEEPAPLRQCSRRGRPGAASGSEIAPPPEGSPGRPESPGMKIDRDLETICLKCLRKQPEQRYASAEALAEDLERWRRGEPIRARPSAGWERLVKWTRRHPARAASVGLGIAASAIIVTLLSVTEAGMRRERNNALEHERKAGTAAARAEAAAREALEARGQTRQNLYAADMLLAQHALDDGNLGLARRLIEAYLPKNSKTINQVASIGPDLRGFEWRYLWKRCQGDPRETLYGHSNAVQSVAFSADGRLLASGDAAGQVILWETASRRPIATLEVSDQPVARVTFSPDGRELATGDSMGRVKVWNLAARKTIWEHKGRNLAGVQFSPVARWIGVTSGDMVRSTNSAALVVDWTTGKEVFRVGPDADFEAFSSDGKLAFITRRREVGTEIWELKTGRVMKTIPEWNGSLVISPDGGHLASAGEQRGGIFVADLTGSKPPFFLSSKFSVRLALAFSADSELLASAGSDQVVRLWNVAGQREAARLLGHVDDVTGVAYSPDGKLLATSSADQTVMLWPTARQIDAEMISNAWPPYVMSPDGAKLAGSTGLDPDGRSQVMIWDLATHSPTPLGPPGQALTPEFFSADSRTFFARGPLTSAGMLPLSRWGVRDLTQPSTTTWLELGWTNEVLSGAATPNGEIYAVGQRGRESITLWHPLSGRAAGELRTPAKQFAGLPDRFSPDGRKLAVYVYWDGIRLADLGAPNRTIDTRLPSTVRDGVFSPDGKALAVPGKDHTIRLLDTSTLGEVAVLRGHQQAVVYVAFSPDGRTLASCGLGGVVKLWNWPARREVATLAQGLREFCFLAFTPDGNALVAGGWGATQVFRVPSLAAIDREP
jgi:serine/threonine protein kinase/WD40 repeat protein